MGRERTRERQRVLEGGGEGGSKEAWSEEVCFNGNGDDDGDGDGKGDVKGKGEDDSGIPD